MGNPLQPEVVIAALLDVRAVNSVCWCPRGWFARERDGRVRHLKLADDHQPKCLQAQRLLHQALEAIR